MTKDEVLQPFNSSDALHMLTRANAHLFFSRCPEHWQGYEHLTLADKSALNIIDYAALAVRQGIRLGRPPQWRAQ